MFPKRVVLLCALVLFCFSSALAQRPGPQFWRNGDCEPYEAGKSQIKRRFTADHTYRTAGDYRIQFRLKRKDKPIAAATTSVKIKPGLGDPGGDIR